MKNTTLNRIIAASTFLIGLSMAFWPGQDPIKVITVIIIGLGYYILGYLSRRPHPNERTLSDWYNIIVLKLKIGILKKNLKPFNDLRKYRHKSELHIKAMVNGWRLKLKEFERELKNLA